MIIEPTGLGVRDLVAEALAGILQRPGRSLLTCLGTVLGVGAFVAVLGLTATASGQIGTRFDALAATEVTVEDSGKLDPKLTPTPFPDDAEARLARVHGVIGGGVWWPVRGVDVRAAPVGAAAAGAPVPVLAATPGLFTAAGARMTAGRTFDAYHQQAGARVAVLGAGIARQLGIGSLETRPAVFIGDVPYSVIGIAGEVQRMPALLVSVTIPAGSAPAIGAAPGEERPRMLIATRAGAARQVAAETPLALRPDAPDVFTAVAPPDPRTLRDQVDGDLGTLLLMLAGVSLVIGAVGIANTTLVAVLERAGEIGLRRAVGARGVHIAAQFLTESAALGTLGGLFGCSLGVVTVVATAAVQGWTPIAEPLAVAAAPLIGLVTGLVAGAYPAYRAARVEPVEALRR